VRNLNNVSIKQECIVSPAQWKDEDFQVWWTMFKVFATAKGVIAAILAKEADPSSH
jgi:hypothetical protein